MLHRKSKTKGLVLPTNYELISEDEARQISGGIDFYKHWWGVEMHITHGDVEHLTGILGAAGAIAEAGAFISGQASGAAIAASLSPIIGAIAAALVFNAGVLYLYDKASGNGAKVRATWTGQVCVLPW